MGLPAKRGVKPEGITPRIKEALQMSVDGHSQREIAEKYGVSQYAVCKWFNREGADELRHKLLMRRLNNEMGRNISKLVEQRESSDRWISQNATRELIRMVEADRRKESEEIGTSVVFENMPLPGSPVSAELPGGTDDGYEDTIDGEFVER